MNAGKLITGCLVAALASPVALAQPTEEPEPEPQQQREQSPDPMPEEQEVPEITEEDLAKFVQAYKAVLQVREEYTEKLRQAEDHEESRELQQASNEAVNAAIEDSGMTRDRYREVATAVNADPEIREKLNERLEEAGVDSPTSR